MEDKIVIVMLVLLFSSRTRDMSLLLKEQREKRTQKNFCVCHVTDHKPLNEHAHSPREKHIYGLDCRSHVNLYKAKKQTLEYTTVWPFSLRIYPQNIPNKSMCEI